jgi:colanic acid biosynthesis glycosyl transferase WcaI
VKSGICRILPRDWLVDLDMRLHLQDFSGHPFQVQLSRNLAARGHEVVHSYSSQYITGHGRLTLGPDDPASLRIHGIHAAAPMIKYSPLGRARFEFAYADAWRRSLEGEQFDVVVACNVPLFAMAKMRRYFAAHQQPWVFWHQDIYSAGMAAESSRRLPAPAARLTGRAFARAEIALVRDAAAVVAIGERFVHQYRRWGVRHDHVRVVPNWAPLDDLTPGERDNPWSIRQQLPTAPVRLMYAGTLGRKHNPLLLLELLDGCRDRGLDATLVVVSEGVGADDLALAAAGRDDVRILGYQPAEQLRDMLASADVMVALLEPDAAQFSVPSKVLSYLSAGRPTIALVPEGNPSAADVSKAGGFIGEPTQAGARAAADWLADVTLDPLGLAVLGEQARELAEERFDIDRIGTTFEQILQGAIGRPVRVHSSSGHRSFGHEPLLAVSSDGDGGMR